MVGKVGKDFFGDSYIQNFKDNGVNTACVFQAPDVATGAASIVVNDAGENAIVIVAGANLLLGAAELQASLPALSRTTVLLCQLEIRPECSLQALRTARQHNVKTIFNPAPAVPDLDPDFYTLSDVLCCNESEAELLTGSPVATVEDARRASGELLGRGCGAVLLTMGAQGCVVLEAKGAATHHVPAPAVTAVDTTGAGDSFLGALAFYMAHYPALPLEEMARRANHVAGVSVQAVGTQASYPSRTDLPAELF
ncbi:ribokinase isoform X2 [Gadus chalcogrammus]|nr:ribokinase isoform X2 [Gadus chalcogrammus]XP_056446209.1 ribokinase isoform X2 [Gadus chalcogrammus]